MLWEAVVETASGGMGAGACEQARSSSVVIRQDREDQGLATERGAAALSEPTDPHERSEEPFHQQARRAARPRGKGPRNDRRHKQAGGVALAEDPERVEEQAADVVGGR